MNVPRGGGLSPFGTILYIDSGIIHTSERMKSGNRKSTRKRSSPPPASLKSDPGSAGPEIFCTECGATLENFCFSDGANDIAAIRKTLAQCRKQGRFTGDFCSKLFIAHPEAAHETPDGTDGDSDA
jgi:hypothetical protein